MNPHPRGHPIAQLLSGGSYAKEMVIGNVVLRDFFPILEPDPVSTSVNAAQTEGLRGHAYDLRVTLQPVGWLVVLNKFALSVSTPAYPRLVVSWNPR